MLKKANAALWWSGKELRAELADTGRPGYDPRALFKLYLYGYLNQIRSSRHPDAECLRNAKLLLA